MGDTMAAGDGEAQEGPYSRKGQLIRPEGARVVGFQVVVEVEDLERHEGWDGLVEVRSFDGRGCALAREPLAEG